MTLARTRIDGGWMATLPRSLSRWARRWLRVRASGRSPQCGEGGGPLDWNLDSGSDGAAPRLGVRAPRDRDAAPAEQTRPRGSGTQGAQRGALDGAPQVQRPDAPLPIYQELTQAFSGTEVRRLARGARRRRSTCRAAPLRHSAGGPSLRHARRSWTDLLATALRTNPDPHVTIVAHLDGTAARHGTREALRHRLWSSGGFQAAQVGNALPQRR
jgi:hypothetical protein